MTNHFNLPSQASADENVGIIQGSLQRILKPEFAQRLIPFNKLLLFFGLVLYANNLFAQPEFSFASLKAKFPQEDIYVLTQKEHIFINEKNDGLKIRSEKSTDILYLSDKAAQLSQKSIFYSDHFSNIHDIEAKTWIPDGNRLKSVNVSNILSRKPVKGGVFYDDYMEKYFNFQGLQPGAVSTLNYTEDVLDPHFLGSFYFGFYAPVRSAEFKVTFPDDVKIKYLLLDKNKVVKLTETHSRGQITYTFTSDNVEGIKYDGDSPDISYYAPHVILYVDSYTSHGKEEKVLSGLPELYKWYSSMMSQMKPERGPQMKALVDSIVRGKTTQEEKIRTIFYWLQDNIKYIAFEDGLGGFIPRNPDDIFNKRFGDCKDKAVLLNSMLAEAGITSYPTWIGTRDIPYSYSDIPSPVVDNHMIAAMRYNNDWMFLDGTSMHLPFGMPTSMIQGKEALIGISADSFVIAKVPVIDRQKNLMNTDFTITIDKNNISGHGTSSVTGYGQQMSVVSLEQMSEQKRMEYLEKNMSFGNNKYKISDLSLSGMENRDTALSYSFNYTMSDYVNEVDNKLYINLHLKKPLYNDKIDIENRKTDREVDYKYIDRLQSSMEIPSGYTINKLPENRKFENPHFGFTINYERSGNAVVLKRELWVDTLLVKREEFPAWNEMIDKLNQSYKELVLISKK